MRGPRARAAHLLLTLVGLLLVLYPLTLGAHPAIRCRGVQIGPGQSCPKAGDVGVQTYEQRRRTLDEAKPVIVGVGVLVVGFGIYLLVSDRRRREDPQR